VTAAAAAVAAAASRQVRNMLMVAMMCKGYIDGVVVAWLYVC